MPGQDPVDCRSNKQARKKHWAGMTDTGETEPKVETCTLQLEVDVEPNQDPWISAKPPQFILHGTSNSPSSLSNVDSMGDCGSAVSPQHSTPVDVPSLPSPAPNEVTVLITGFGVSDLRFPPRPDPDSILTGHTSPSNPIWSTPRTSLPPRSRRPSPFLPRRTPSAPSAASPFMFTRLRFR